jgi:hypothetical protein
MRIIGVVLFAVALGGCGKCLVDCAVGYELVPGTCTCRPIPYSGGAAGTPLGPCGSDSTCLYGLACIEGCPASRLPYYTSVAGICSMGGRDSCGCGAVADTCSTPGTACLMPACCDYQGLCVTAEERATICARPEAVHFDCSKSDVGP